MSETYDPLKSPYHPLKHLAFLRHGFKDEIPERIVHSIDPDNKYKVRGGWWAAAIQALERATFKGMIADEELKPKIREFTNWVRERRPKEDDPVSLRSARDITRANEFIDSVLAATGYTDVPLDLESFRKVNPAHSTLLSEADEQ